MIVNIRKTLTLNTAPADSAFVIPELDGRLICIEYFFYSATFARRSQTDGTSVPLLWPFALPSPGVFTGPFEKM